jgi:hypothetical protein
MFGLVALLTRKGPVIDLAQRAPEFSIARRETLAMWTHAAMMMAAGPSDRAALVWRRDCPSSEWVAGRGYAYAVTDRGLYMGGLQRDPAGAHFLKVQNTRLGRAVEPELWPEVKLYDPVTLASTVLSLLATGVLAC